MLRTVTSIFCIIHKVLPRATEEESGPTFSLWDYSQNLYSFCWSVFVLHVNMILCALMHKCIHVHTI